MTSGQTEEDVSVKQVLPLTGTIYGLPKTPANVICPSCKINMKTKVEHQLVTPWQHLVKTFISCISCCGHFNIFLDTQTNNGDFNHYCANCGCFLGRYDEYYGGKAFCEI